MMRKFLLLMSAALAVSIPAVAEDASTVVTSVSRAEAPEALRIEDMTDVELQQRLAEYETGKRDYRDGYIVLNQLWFNHQAKRRTNSPEFLAIDKKREALLKKHPDLNNLQDFRLSEKVQFEQAKKATESEVAAARRNFVPADKIPMRIMGVGKNAVAVYQYRLVFFSLPSNVQLGTGGQGDRLKLLRNGTPIQPDQLSSTSVMTFKDPIDVLPALTDEAKAVLVCTNPLGYYSSKTPEELAAFGYGMRWRNAAGTYDNFCGVVALDGSVVYRFPAQSEPNRMLRPIGIHPEGKQAEVMVGKKVLLAAGEDGTEPQTVIDSPIEILKWRPGKLEKVKPAKAASWSELQKDFRRRVEHVGQ